MKARFWNVAGVVIAGALIVSGCASSTTPASETAPSAQAQSPAVSAATTDGQGDGTGTIRMVLWPGPEGDAMQKVVDAYNAGQGATDGIEVEMILLSRTDTFAREATMMATKSSDVDLYFTASYLIGQHAPALDPIEGIDTSAYFPVAVDGLAYDGKQYGLPLDVSNHFMIYRKDLTDRLLSDTAWQAEYAEISQAVVGQALQPKDPSEWNWTDFQAAAAFFTKQYNPDSPTTYGTALAAKNLLFNVMLWDNVLWSFGGNWVDDSNKPALSSEAGRKAMQVYYDIYTKGLTSPDSAQAEFPETQAALKTGNAAFAIQWSAGFAELNDPTKSPDVAGKMAVAPVPGGKTHVHALAVGVNKYGTNKAAVARWMAYLSSAKAMDAYAKAGGIPAMPAVLEANKDKNPIFPQISESLEKYGYAEPALPNTFLAYSKLSDALSAAWVGQVPIEDALKAADEQLSTLVP